MACSILFLTTLNLASNPRLVKEIELAISSNFSVTVICFEFDNWSKKNNDVLINRLSLVEFITIPAGRKPLYSWLINTLKETLFRVISYFMSLPVHQLSQAVSRRSDMLIHALNKAELSHINLVVGHNTGAIYPTLFAAKKINAKVGFDVEDYHPGEGNNKKLKSLTLQLMRKTLPFFDYLSYGSESIYKECTSKIVGLDKPTNLIINNVFSNKEFLLENSIIDDKLQLVWFSQNIDKNRGLEKIIPIVDKLSDFINLTLFGNANSNFKDLFSNYKGVIWAGSITQNNLHQQLSRFDIGLALEPGKDLNNELALSNKLCAYLQAGLFVVATDTIEQRRFINDYIDGGLLIKKDFSDAELMFTSIIEKKDELRSKRFQRYKINQKISWENESVKLLEIWCN